MVKIKVMESMSLTGFIGFVITIVIFFFTNVKIDWSDVWHDGSFKFICYFLIIATIIAIGIERPQLSKFFKALYEALQDGKLTPEEQVGLIRLAFTELMGFWADITNALSARNKQEAEEQSAADLPDLPETK